MPRVFLELKGGSPHSIAWSPDSNVLLVGTGGAVYSWTEDSAALTVLVSLGSTIKSISWNKEGEIFAIAAPGLIDGVRVYMRDGSIIKKMGGGKLKPVKVAFNSSGKLMAAAYNGNIHIWDKSLSTRFVIPLGNVSITDACWHPDGKHVVAATAEGGIYVVNFDGEIVFKDSIKTPISAVAFSSDGWALIAGTEKGEVHIWRDNYKMHTKKKAHGGKVSAITWSPRNEMFLTADTNGVILKWGRDGNELGIFRERLKPILCMDWSPNERYFAIGTITEGVHVVTPPVPVGGLPVSLPHDAERLDIEATLAISLFTKGAHTVDEFASHGIAAHRLKDIINALKKDLNINPRSRSLMMYFNELSRYVTKGDLLSLILQFGFFRGKALWEYGLKLEKHLPPVSEDPVLIREVARAVKESKETVLLEIAGKIKRGIIDVVSAYRAISKERPRIVAGGQEILKEVIKTLENIAKGK